MKTQDKKHKKAQTKDLTDKEKAVAQKLAMKGFAQKPPFGIFLHKYSSILHKNKTNNQRRDLS